jgi:hypothetical protein
MVIVPSTSAAAVNVMSFFIKPSSLLVVIAKLESAEAQPQCITLYTIRESWGGLPLRHEAKYGSSAGIMSGGLSRSDEVI